jgi:hypothetical protein
MFCLQKILGWTRLILYAWPCYCEYVGSVSYCMIPLWIAIKSMIVLDSTYSFALMLLLKYPSPSPPHRPQTFVEDAAFLRDNLNVTGGTTLITKYSGRAPQVYTPSRSSTPFDINTSPRQRLVPRRSPLPSAASFLQQQGGVGELFQGAARGLLDQGERLGINKAVRDAVEEAKKNVSQTDLRALLTGFCKVSIMSSACVQLSLTQM